MVIVRRNAEWADCSFIHSFIQKLVFSKSSLSVLSSACSHWVIWLICNYFYKMYAAVPKMLYHFVLFRFVLFFGMRCGAVRCGAVRCGAVRCGVAWCGVVWCGVWFVVCCVIYCSVVWYVVT